jgi:hypothetical protein
MSGHDVFPLISSSADFYQMLFYQIPDLPNLTFYQIPFYQSPLYQAPDLMNLKFYQILFYQSTFYQMPDLLNLTFYQIPFYQSPFYQIPDLLKVDSIRFRICTFSLFLSDSVLSDSVIPSFPLE